MRVDIIIILFLILVMGVSFIYLLQFEKQKEIFCEKYNLQSSSFGGTYCLNITGDTYQEVLIVNTKYGIKFRK